MKSGMALTKPFSFSILLIRFRSPPSAIFACASMQSAESRAAACPSVKSNSRPTLPINWGSPSNFGIAPEISSISFSKAQPSILAAIGGAAIGISMPNSARRLSTHPINCFPFRPSP